MKIHQVLEKLQHPAPGRHSASVSAPRLSSLAQRSPVFGQINSLVASSTGHLVISLVKSVFMLHLEFKIQKNSISPLKNFPM